MKEISVELLVQVVTSSKVTVAFGKPVHKPSLHHFS